MIRNFPLFPLSLVVFPGESLRLHIFEPRYIQLINDCLDKQKLFGIPPYFEGKELKYGTTMTIESVVKRYKDGKMDIQTRAVGWFEIYDFFKVLPDKLYPGGRITDMPWDDLADHFLSVRLIALINELYRVMNISNVHLNDTISFRTHQIAHKVGFSIEQELEFLTIAQEIERQNYMIAHLEHLIPIVKQAEDLRKKAEMNGHFRNIAPPDL